MRRRVCVPVLHEHDATLVRAFADDLVALFDEPGQALDAAFEIHRRIALFNHSTHASEKPAQACIGIGYGDVYAIGPNLAMGDEMNRASKLGEDTARGNETLVTANVYFALRNRSDVLFEQLAQRRPVVPVLPRLNARVRRGRSRPQSRTHCSHQRPGRRR